MKDEYISIDSATPEEWDSVSNLTYEHRRDTIKKDPVGSPEHYTDVPAEYEHHRVMDAIGANYHFSNAMKYLWRAGKKSSEAMTIEDKEIQDVRKAVRYLEMWLELRQESETKRNMYDGTNKPDYKR